MVRPEPAIVEMSDFGQRIEAPAMGVAGEIIQFFEFAKDGEIGVSAESVLQFRQIKRSCCYPDAGAARRSGKKRVR